MSGKSFRLLLTWSLDSGESYRRDRLVAKHLAASVAKVGIFSPTVRFDNAAEEKVSWGELLSLSLGAPMTPIVLARFEEEEADLDDFRFDMKVSAREGYGSGVPIVPNFNPPATSTFPLMNTRGNPSRSNSNLAVPNPQSPQKRKENDKPSRPPSRALKKTREVNEANASAEPSTVAMLRKNPSREVIVIEDDLMDIEDVATASNLARGVEAASICSLRKNISSVVNTPSNRHGKASAVSKPLKGARAWVHDLEELKKECPVLEVDGLQLVACDRDEDDEGVASISIETDEDLYFVKVMITEVREYPKATYLAFSDTCPSQGINTHFIQSVCFFSPYFQFIVQDVLESMAQEPERAIRPAVVELLRKISALDSPQETQEEESYEGPSFYGSFNLSASNEEQAPGLKR